jgi:hypothetical protein
MKAPHPKHVTSVTALSRELGLSRQWVTELFKLPDHPKTNNGSGHSVTAWRKYITRRAEKVQSHGSEKSRLQIELLKIRAEREAHELSVSRDEIRERIHDEYHELFARVMRSFIAELRRMVGELAPRFEALSAREIYALWNLRQQAAFDQARSTFLGKEPATKNRTATVVPFEVKARAIA